MCQECRRAVFWARYCSSCTPQSFFLFWKISWSVIPMSPLWWVLCHPCIGGRVAVTESLIRDLGRVREWCDPSWMILNASQCIQYHNAYPGNPINYWWNSAEGVWWPIVILGVAFDSKMTFEKDLSSVSRPASQRLCILRKSWRVFHDISLLWRCFRGFDLPILEYCTALLCLAADAHLKLLDRVISGVHFLTVCVFECDIAHRRSVAVLSMLYKIRCNPMHPVNGALPVAYLPLLVTRGILMRLLDAEPLSTEGPLFSSLGSCGTIFHTLYLMVWDWRVSRAVRKHFYWPQLLDPFSSSTVFPFLFFLSICWYCGVMVIRLIMCKSLSPMQPCTADLFSNNNRNNNMKKIHSWINSYAYVAVLRQENLWKVKYSMAGSSLDENQL